MVKIGIEQAKKMMYQTENIRNISVIAHVDHGKSTLTDSLIGKAGLIAKSREGLARFTDTLPEEQARAITIKSTSVSLCYKKQVKSFNENEEKKMEANQHYLINLIDSPGHVDFSSEVTAALRVTDGALVVVDCVEGVCVQTETVLRQAICERIKTILFINKMDRFFLELKPSLEECYKNLKNSIESVNVVCSTYQDKTLEKFECHPQEGKVGFGSGLQAWGFTLADFAYMYGGKFGLGKKKLMEKLWGENYWCPSKKKWLNKPSKKQQNRGFCEFVLRPIQILYNAIMDGDNNTFEPIIQALRLKLDKKSIEKIKRQKDLVKLVMQTWLPAGDALLEMITTHLPSPKEAQKYRVGQLYTGPLDSTESDSIRTCDNKGPLAMYISKLVPSTDKGRFVAFGRVFSGTIKTGQEIRILGPDYEYGKKKDIFTKKVQRVLMMMGRFNEQLAECPAGNVCGVVGIDEYLEKSGTLTDSEMMYPFHTMKFTVTNVVQVAVQPTKVQDLPKLIDALKKLSQGDQLIKCSSSKTGEHIVSGAGHLHLEVCLKTLQNEYMKGAEIKISDPVVSLSETISHKTGENKKYPKLCLGRSSNGHNKLYTSAEPMEEKLVYELEQKHIMMGKGLDKLLSNEYKWNISEARKIWTFGCPPDSIGNCIVDLTKGVQYINEIKDHVIAGLMEVVKNGKLCDEVMRGVRFNICDAKLHADAIHRGPGQIGIATKSALWACELASGPKIMEPIYLVNITAPQLSQAGVFKTLSSLKGTIQKIEPRIGTPLINITAHLPVRESFTFCKTLRKNTGGKAFPQMKFSHWQVINSDPLTKDSKAYDIVMKCRERKGLKLELPNFYDYCHKL